MKNRNFLEPNEDIFQKSLHQEADFYKGIIGHNYKSASFFALVSAFVLLFDIFFVFVTSATIVGLVQSLGSMSLIDIFLIIPISFLFLFVVVFYKLTKGLFLIFIKKDKHFKAKTILILAIPVIFYAIIVFGLLNLIFFPPGWHSL